MTDHEIMARLAARTARKALHLCALLIAIACSSVGAIVIGRALGNCIADMLQW